MQNNDALLLPCADNLSYVLTFYSFICFGISYHMNAYCYISSIWLHREILSSEQLGGHVATKSDTPRIELLQKMHFKKIQVTLLLTKREGYIPYISAASWDLGVTIILLNNLL